MKSLGQIILLISLLLGSASLHAAYTETVNSITVTSGNYVIDSDSTRPGVNYARDKISVSSNVSCTGSGTVSYRYDYQLLDSSDNLILLNNGSAGTTTIFQGTAFSVSSPIGKVLVESFAPAAQIDISRVHRVRLLVKTRPLLGVLKAQKDTGTSRLIHFRNTNPADAEANVHGYISQSRWVKKCACDTDPSNSALTAEADLVLYRYDNYLSAAAAAVRTVKHHITYQLRESGSGTVVGIAKS